MNWKALKDGRCPKCGAMLYEHHSGGTLACSKQSCGFTIRESRLKEILQSPPRRREIEPEDNLTRHE